MMPKKKISLKNKILILIAGLLIYYYLFPLYKIVTIAKFLPEKVNPIKHSLSAKDFQFIDMELDYVKSDLLTIQKLYKRYLILRPLPLIGPYVNDANTVLSFSIGMIDIVNGMVEKTVLQLPSVSFAGYASDVNKQAGDKDLLQKSVTDIATYLPDYKGKFVSLNDSIQSVDPKRYPFRIFGFNLRRAIISFQESIGLVVTSFDDAVGLLYLAPDLLGFSEPKNYFVVVTEGDLSKPETSKPLFYALLNISGDKFVFNSVGDYSKLNTEDEPLIYDNAVNAILISKLSDLLNKKIYGAVVVDQSLFSDITNSLGGIPLEGRILAEEEVNTLIKTFSNSQQQQKDRLYAMLMSMIDATIKSSTVIQSDILKKSKDRMNEGRIKIYVADQRIQTLLNSYSKL